MMPGAWTRDEIVSQPAIWEMTLAECAAQLGGIPRSFASAPIIATGCGSTYYLALYAAAVLRGAGLQAWALPASELVYLPEEQLPHAFDLLAISRSGTTSETVWAVERYRQRAQLGQVTVISCVPDTPLAAQADVLLLAPHAQERSIAQTRSFTSMTLLARALAGWLGGDPQPTARLGRLPQSLAALIAREAPLAQQIGSDLSIDRFFFLGNGALYGIACEAMLKTKEMTCSWSEAFHPLEFRHGPMSVAGAGALVVGLISESAAAAEIAVLREMRRLGSRTLALVERRGSHDWSGVDTVIELGSGLEDGECAVLYLPILQWIAFHRALAKGLDPDRPTNLTAVVQLER